VTGTTASIVVTTGTTTAQTLQLPLAPTAPGCFSNLAFNQDGTLNSPANPAAAGSVVGIYATGLGVTDPPEQDGVKNSSLVLAEAVAPVTATIGGKAATVVYAGSTPGGISGLMQVELLVPVGFANGTVVLTVGGVNTSAAISVK
jgi:uncharacterized protein (TIGR03437 family)